MFEEKSRIVVQYTGEYNQDIGLFKEDITKLTLVVIVNKYEDNPDNEEIEDIRLFDTPDFTHTIPAPDIRSESQLLEFIKYNKIKKGGVWTKTIKQVEIVKTETLIYKEQI